MSLFAAAEHGRVNKILIFFIFTFFSTLNKSQLNIFLQKFSLLIPSAQCSFTWSSSPTLELIWNFILFTLIFISLQLICQRRCAEKKEREKAWKLWFWYLSRASRRERNDSWNKKMSRKSFLFCRTLHKQTLILSTVSLRPPLSLPRSIEKFMCSAEYISAQAEESSA